MNDCSKKIKQRPFILGFIVITSFVFRLLEHFNPYTKRIGSLSDIMKEDYLKIIASLADKIKEIAITPWLAILTLGVIIILGIAISAILGIFYAGYSQCLYVTLLDYKTKKEDFKTGINRHSSKVTAYFFATILSIVFFGVMILFSAVPAIMSIKLFFSGKDSGVFFQMLLLCVLTLGILYFAVVFISMYLSYLLPSLVSFKKGGMRVSFKMVNGYCWYLMPKTTLYLIVMLLLKVILLLVGYGLSSIGTTIIVFILSWIAHSAADFIYIYFVFSTFIAMKDDMFPVKTPEA